MDFSKMNGYIDACLSHFPSPTTLLVGVSGGADSVALLRLLYEKQQEKGFSLHVVHVHHGLRQEAEKDVHFVRSLCETLALPCHVRYVTILGNDVENKARKARYEAFQNVYHSISADGLFLAHHQGDQAETMLMHLLYGAGSKGLCAMQRETTLYGMKVFRPLLSLPQVEIYSFLQSIHQTYRLDESNHDTKYTRNFLRHDVFPLMETRFPKAQENLWRCSELLQEEDSLLHQMAEAFLEKNACRLSPCPFIMLSPFLELHLALKRRVLRLFLQEATLSFEKTQEILADLKTPHTVNLPNGDQLTLTKERLHHVKTVDTFMPLDKTDWFDICCYTGQRSDGKRHQVIPKKIFEEATLRYRQENDFIIPFSRKTSIKLKDFLIDKKVDQPFKRHLPLLAIGNEVLYVLGVGGSEKLRLDATCPSLFLQIKKRLPFEQNER